MMNTNLKRKRCLTWLLTGGFLMQLGSCNFGNVATSVTLDGRELIITLIRSAILTPLDQFITDSVNDLFADDN